MTCRVLCIKPYPPRRGRQRHVRMERGLELPVVGALLAGVVHVVGAAHVVRVVYVVGVVDVVGVGGVAGVAGVAGVVGVGGMAGLVVKGDVVEVVEVVEIVEVGVKRRQPGERLRQAGSHKEKNST